MRITDNLRAYGLQQNIQTSLSALSDVQQEISTGRKLNSPSDNPAGTSQDLALRTSLLDNTQYESDANAAHDFLSASDGALSSVNGLLDSVRQIAVQGASGGTQTPDSLNALADQVDSAIKQITDLANTDIHGKYLFAGTSTQLAAGVKPFALAAGATPSYQYSGDENAVAATLGPGDSLALNSPGANKSLFGDTIAALQTLSKDLRTPNSSNAISADISAVDARITATTSARAAIGDKSNEVTSIQQRLARLDTEYQTSLSNVENVDLSQAYVQLQSAQNVYQASLVTVSNAYKYSLADFLH